LRKTCPKDPNPLQARVTGEGKPPIALLLADLDVTKTYAPAWRRTRIGSPRSIHSVSLETHDDPLRNLWVNAWERARIGRS